LFHIVVVIFIITIKHHPHHALFTLAAATASPAISQRPSENYQSFKHFTSFKTILNNHHRPHSLLSQSTSLL
jgi:hypothetical protein